LIIDLQKDNNLLSNIDVIVKFYFFMACIMIIIIETNLDILLSILGLSIIFNIIINGLNGVFDFIKGIKFQILLLFITGFLISTFYQNFDIVGLFVKFLSVILLSSILSRTLNPDEVTDALIRMRVNPNLAWSIGVTLRQMIFVYEDMMKIRHIQKLNSKSKSLIKNSEYMLVSIYANAIIRSSHFEKGLISRGFNKVNKNIITFNKKTRRIDYLLVAIITLILIVYLIGR
tara:strand:+ start:1345 stop:2037 length:693 start_codon:yes stop_codon:yes gene_type:complete